MNNKYFRYTCLIISLGFVFSALPVDGAATQSVTPQGVASRGAVQQSMAQEIEPELAQLLADNPDIADKLFVSKKIGNSKPNVSQQDLTQPGQTDVSGQSGEIKELGLKLVAISDAFNSIFNDYLFLAQTTSLNQTELRSLMLYIDNEIAYIKKMLQQSAGKTMETHMCECDIKMLCEIIYWFKFACLHLEVFSVSSDDSNISAVKDPLDFIEMQQAKLNIIDSLFELYKKREFSCSLPDMQTQLNRIESTEISSELLVKSIILKSLPARLQSSSFTYIFYASTRYLNKILSQNFYSNNIVLAEEYFELVSTFYKVQNFGITFDVVSFLIKIDEVINSFAASARDARSHDSGLALKLLLTKLIKIQNDVAKFYKPALIFKDNQEKTKLFIRFSLLLEDKRLELFHADKQFYALFDLYCNTLKSFFSDTFNPADMDIKLFELECKFEKDMAYRQSTSLKQWLLTYWIDKKAPLWKWVLSYCKNPNNALFEEMETLLHDVITFVNNGIKSKSKGFLAKIKDSIFSGKWIDSGKLKNMGVGGSQSAVDFLEFVFDRKFENFKEAAFFLLARVSPVLAAGLIYKIMPHLSGNLKKKASELLNSTGIDLSDESDDLSDAGPSNTGNSIPDKSCKSGTGMSSQPGVDNKIFDFISKNPEIFNKLCEVKPELVNGLADVVQHRLLQATA